MDHGIKVRKEMLQSGAQRNHSTKRSKTMYPWGLQLSTLKTKWNKKIKIETNIISQIKSITYTLILNIWSESPNRLLLLYVLSVYYQQEINSNPTSYQKGFLLS